MSEVSNEKLKKFVNAMDDLVELGEELMEDGKIDLGDITSLPKAGSVLSELIETIILLQCPARASSIELSITSNTI